MTQPPPLSITTVCAGCSDELVIDRKEGTLRSSRGESRRLTYADAALLVWDCPSCGHTDAEDLAALTA
jgi:hypothetical protein